MRTLLGGTLGAALCVATALPATAATPNGHGLVAPYTVNCPALGGEVQMTEPPGLAPSHWVIGGVHLVMTSMTIDGTLYKTWGQKTGLSTIDCTATHIDPDGTTVHAAVVFAVLPGN